MKLSDLAEHISGYIATFGDQEMLEGTCFGEFPAIARVRIIPADRDGAEHAVLWITHVVTPSTSDVR